MSRFTRLLSTIPMTMVILTSLLGSVPTVVAAQTDRTIKEEKPEPRPTRKPEIRVPNDRQSSPPEPGEAPDAPVSVDGRRSVRNDVVPDERSFSGSEKHEDFTETTTRQGRPVPDKKNDESEPVDEGFVPGVSEYLASESTSTKHVWQNPDGSISVRYTQTTAEADPQTGEIIDIGRRFVDVGEGPVAGGDDAARVSLPSSVPASPESGQKPSRLVSVETADGIQIGVSVGRLSSEPTAEESIDPATQEDKESAAKSDKGEASKGNAEKNSKPEHTDHKAQSEPNGRVRFEDVAGGADVEITALTDGVRVDFLVDNAEEALGLTQTIELPEGWSAKQDNGIAFLLDESGERAGVWAGGIATDETGIPSATDARLVIVSEDGRYVTATIEVSEAWLRDESRQYPVRIDPTYTIGTHGARDTWMAPGITTPLGNHGLLELTLQHGHLILRLIV